MLVPAQQGKDTSLLISKTFSLPSFLGQRKVSHSHAYQRSSTDHPNEDLQEALSGPVNMEFGKTPKIRREGEPWMKGISFPSEPFSIGCWRVVVNLAPGFIPWTFLCPSFQRPNWQPQSHKVLTRSIKIISFFDKAAIMRECLLFTLAYFVKYFYILFLLLILINFDNLHVGNWGIEK